MKFTVVEELPKKRKEYNRLGNYLEEFMRMNVKVVRVDLDVGEYSCPRVCQSTLHSAAKRRALPIKVSLRSDKVYLVRTDM